MEPRTCDALASPESQALRAARAAARACRAWPGARPCRPRGPAPRPLRTRSRSRRRSAFAQRSRDLSRASACRRHSRRAPASGSPSARCRSALVERVERLRAVRASMHLDAEGLKHLARDHAVHVVVLDDQRRTSIARRRSRPPSTSRAEPDVFRTDRLRSMAVKQKREPCAGRALDLDPAPIASTMRWLIARPSPVPPRAGCACRRPGGTAGTPCRSRRPGCRCRCHDLETDPRIAEQLRFGAASGAHAALLGELDRVAEQIEQDLLEPLRVADDPSATPGPIERQATDPCSRRWRETAR